MRKRDEGLARLRGEFLAQERSVVADVIDWRYDDVGAADKSTQENVCLLHAAVMMQEAGAKVLDGGADELHAFADSADVQDSPPRQVQGRGSGSSARCSSSSTSCLRAVTSFTAAASWARKCSVSCLEARRCSSIFRARVVS